MTQILSTMAFCIVPGKQASGEAPSQVARGTDFFQVFPYAHFSQPHPEAHPKDRKPCIPRVLPGSDKGETGNSTQNPDGARAPSSPGTGRASPRGGHCQVVVSSVWSGGLGSVPFHGRLGPELHIRQSRASGMLTCLSQN